MFASWLNTLTNSLRSNWSGSNPYREICRNLSSTPCKKLFFPTRFWLSNNAGASQRRRWSVLCLGEKKPKKTKNQNPPCAGCPARLPWPGGELPGQPPLHGPGTFLPSPEQERRRKEVTRSPPVAVPPSHRAWGVPGHTLPKPGSQKSRCPFFHGWRANSGGPRRTPVPCRHSTNCLISCRVRPGRGEGAFTAPGAPTFEVSLSVSPPPDRQPAPRPASPSACGPPARSRPGRRRAEARRSAAPGRSGGGGGLCLCPSLERGGRAAGAEAEGRGQRLARRGPRPHGGPRRGISRCGPIAGRPSAPPPAAAERRKTRGGCQPGGRELGKGRRVSGTAAVVAAGGWVSCRGALRSGWPAQPLTRPAAAASAQSWACPACGASPACSVGPACGRPGGWASVESACAEGSAARFSSLLRDAACWKPCRTNVSQKRSS